MTKTLNPKIDNLFRKKKNAVPITMLTAYDFPFASIVDAAGIDVILVGDSVANVVLGLESTTAIGIDEMIYHSKAVRRAVKNALLIGDMPYSSYQPRPRDAVKNAERFIQEAGCDGVKIEWFSECPQVTRDILEAGIPVMGHIGLTPQTADQLGGFKVQGRDAEAAKKLIDEAKVLEDLGAFSIVLECIPDLLAKLITESVNIPTIGIGAGLHCDGQVLVIHDILGISGGFKPKFVKSYGLIREEIAAAVKRYKYEVENRLFPDKEHSYSIKSDELEKLKRGKSLESKQT